jgi:hypothetical protein
MTVSCAFICGAARAARDCGVAQDFAVVSPTLNRHTQLALEAVTWAANIATFRFNGGSQVERDSQLGLDRQGYFAVLRHSRYPIHQIFRDLAPSVFGGVNTSCPLLYVDPGLDPTSLKLPGATVAETPTALGQIILGIAVFWETGESGSKKITVAHPSGFVDQEVGNAFADRYIDALISL